MWRWDQGRLDYFRFDEIKKIASALVDFEGSPLPGGDAPDSLRRILREHSDLPFAPDHYTVWRNYGRVFGAQMLAARIGNGIVCTDLCRAIANEEVSSDDYMLHLVNRLYYPSPVFQGYDPAARKVFPLCAIIKWLLAKSRTSLFPGITLEEIESYIIGNGVNGTEEALTYGDLNATNYTEGDSIRRQIRELMVFASQLSFLKWDRGTLYLDADSPARTRQIEGLLHPYIIQHSDDPSQEILNLGAHFDVSGIDSIDSPDTNEAAKVEFKEGSRVEVTHLRLERSGKLREMYFEHADNPQVCDMCEVDTARKYPWADKVIDVHHLLPLASPIRIDKQATSLQDVVGLCPTCHRATHRFYGGWLRGKGIKDFRSYEEARGVYVEAKTSVR